MTTNQPDTTYDASFFISFFEAVPDEKWHTLSVGLADGQRHCAIGLVRYVLAGGIVGEDRYSHPEHVLGKLFGNSESACQNLFVVTQINDGKDPRYQQPTPKARILAALHDIKAKQEQAQPKAPTVQHECPHVYVMDCCLYCCSTKPVEIVKEGV